MRRKSVPKSSSHILSVLAVLFIISAVSRAAFGPLSALAKDSAPPEETALGCSERAGALLDDLLDREAEVAEREFEVMVDLKALSVAREELEKRITALEEMEAKLAATMARAETAAEDDLGQLTTVYETMKPKDAAKLFETMSPEFAAGFLGRMRPDSAAAILTGLDPETAYTISAILAGRNANAPRE